MVPLERAFPGNRPTLSRDRPPECWTSSITKGFSPAIPLFFLRLCHYSLRHR
ncbi:MAG: hypothetical protein NW224_14105 [Leptolyngbyaceae cyanobacterium bins.302]|nr:hypothetical protein [Leptolyngbyaceae cyanobacterium bins.302]